MPMAVILGPIDTQGQHDPGGWTGHPRLLPEHVSSLRHANAGAQFLFSQRGALARTPVIAGVRWQCQTTNLQSMTTSELYLASFTGPKQAGPWR